MGFCWISDLCLGIFYECTNKPECTIFAKLQYRSELWDHLFFDNCLNYPNLNYVSEKFFSLN